MALLTQTMF
jgi:hypothetical protein